MAKRVLINSIDHCLMPNGVLLQAVTSLRRGQ
jgi:hypothetical protein